MCIAARPESSKKAGLASEACRGCFSVSDSFDVDLLGDQRIAGSDEELVKDLFFIIPEWVKDWVHVMLMFVCGHFIYDLAKVIMQFLYGFVIALLAMFVFGGCTLHYDKDKHIGFWNQCVKINGYGFTMTTPYGPFNFGYLTYERNVACEKDIKQQTPLVPTLPSKP